MLRCWTEEEKKEESCWDAITSSLGATIYVFSPEWTSPPPPRLWRTGGMNSDNVLTSGSGKQAKFNIMEVPSILDFIGWEGQALELENLKNYLFCLAGSTSKYYNSLVHDGDLKFSKAGPNHRQHRLDTFHLNVLNIQRRMPIRFFLSVWDSTETFKNQYDALRPWPRC